MLKKHGQLFLSALVVSDSLAILSSWLLAYFIRFELQIFPVTLGVPPLARYVEALVPIWIVFMISIRALGLYRPRGDKPGTGEVLSILKVTSFSVLVLTALTFFYREFSYSRIVTLYFWVVVTALMILSHWLVRRFLTAVRGRGWDLQNVLVVGAGELGQDRGRKAAAASGDRVSGGRVSHAPQGQGGDGRRGHAGAGVV